MGERRLDGETLVTQQKIVYTLQHETSGFDGHACRIERRQAAGYLVCIDKFLAPENLG